MARRVVVGSASRRRQVGVASSRRRVVNSVSMGEAAKPLLFEGFQAGCHVVLRGRRGTLSHSNLFECRKCQNWRKSRTKCFVVRKVVLGSALCKLCIVQSSTGNDFVQALS